MGFWSVQLGNVYYYIEEVKKPETSSSATRATSKKAGGTSTCSAAASLGLGDWHRAALSRCSALWWGLLAAGIHAVMYVFVLSSSINGLCHTVGYKNFDNTATNLRSWRC